MEMIEQSRADAVWQRVRGTLPVSFCLFAGREQSIMHTAQSLYALGAYRPLMKRIYTQAANRRKLLLRMSHLAGEPECKPMMPQKTAELGELVRLLGLGAMEYDPEHPVYGGLFSQFRQECIRGQRMLLSAK